jgi:hypothetical protein
LHDKLVIQKAQIYFNQCENAHQKTYDDIIKLDQQCKATGSRHEKLQKLLTSSPEALALPTPQQLEITMIQNELKQAREDQTIFLS